MNKKPPELGGQVGERQRTSSGLISSETYLLGRY